MPEGLSFNPKVFVQTHQPSAETPAIAAIIDCPKMRKDPADPAESRRASFRGLSGKKVSFSEDRSAVSGTGPAAPEEGSDQTVVGRRSSPVQRAQSQRETKKGGGPLAAAAALRQEYRRANRSSSFRESLRQGESYQVLMLGAVGVGKTSLVRQFQEANNAHVSVKVTNVYGDNCKRANDTQLTIVDNPAMEITAEMAIACCDVDAYVIVYSVTDRESLKTSQEILKAICDQENNSKKAAILVGNKVDLVRRRVVNTQEGKTCATSYGCKFIETSDWIDYNVDELFEGVLAQIRLRLDASTGGKSKKRERRGYRRSKTLGTKSWGALKDFISKINRKVKSCDDLHVL